MGDFKYILYHDLLWEAFKTYYTMAFSGNPPPVPTCHQDDGVLVRVELHLPGDPGPVEVCVPPAFLLALGVFVLVARADERDAEVALLPVHRHLVLPRRDGRSRVLLRCSLTNKQTNKGQASSSRWSVFTISELEEGGETPSASFLLILLGATSETES